MNFSRAGDISKDDFFEINPQHKFIRPFNKVKDSKLMWAIWLWCDPDPDNKVYRLSHDIKLDTVRRYYSDFDLDDVLTQELIEAYSIYYLSPAARAFKEEEESLIHRANMIRRVQDELSRISKDNPMVLADKETQALLSRIDKMRADTLKVYKQYEEVRKLFEIEVKNPKVYGGRKETIREKGDLVITKEEYE